MRIGADWAGSSDGEDWSGMERVVGVGQGRGGVTRTGTSERIGRKREGQDRRDGAGTGRCGKDGNVGLGR